MDKNFYKNLGPIELNIIASKIGAEVISPKNSSNQKPMISGINTISAAESGELAFISSAKYENMILSTKATACIVHTNMAAKYSFDNLWLLVHNNPYFAYAKALDLLYKPLVERKNNIEKTAQIHPTAKIGNNAYIGHYTIIEEGAEIGDDAYIGSNCFIGPAVRIGNNVRIDSNVTISYAVIGNDVVILPGARIGQDGFGFSTEKGKHKKIFHIGRVIIEDDVEIGANATIDRGALKDTLIKSGARLDNLVQIGHNVEIGVGSILVSQVGVAGSTIIGNYCAFGGQAGLAGHITIADKVQVAGQSGVQRSIDEPGAIYFGTPAQPIREWQRQNIAIKKLLKVEK
jgi:UDP-3-O-[3-hydroxymyristoyl] glucosamine N-acyltransferase